MSRDSAARTGYYPGALGKAAAGQKHTRIVYASSTDGHVYAWDSKTGDEIWRYDLGCRILACPAVADGVVYASTLSRYDRIPAEGRTGRWEEIKPCVVALDALSGAVRWKVAPARPVTSSPALADGAVCFGTDDGCLWALSAKDGHALWETKISDGPIEVCPAAGHGVVCGGARDLCALRTDTGEVLWKARLDQLVVEGSIRIRGCTFAPAIAEGMFYVTTSGSPIGARYRYNEVVALDARTGKQVWAKRGAGASGAAAVADGIVYAPSHDCRLYALRAATGEELWKANLDPIDIVVSSGGGDTPLVEDGVVCVTYRGGLRALEARTGKELWNLRPPSDLGSPALVNGVFYGGSCVSNQVGDGLPMRTSCPFLAFEPSSGRTAWQVADKGGFRSGCIVADCLP